MMSVSPGAHFEMADHVHNRSEFRPDWSLVTQAASVQIAHENRFSDLMASMKK
jgi:hypothetical protein